MTKKTLCILANSVKNGHSCIAGIEISKNSAGKWQNTGHWIRPISRRQNGAISDAESYLQKKNRTPRLFDVVSVPLQEIAKVEGQPEDWFITPNEPWEYLGQFNFKESVKAFLEEPDDLWLQENIKSDRVTPAWVAQHKLPSLYLVKPEKLMIYIQESNYGNGPKRGRRAIIRYRGVNYDLAMTDPVASTKYFHDFSTHQTGSHVGIELNCEAVCVSLAPAWKSDSSSEAYHYKLVAAIVESE